MITISIPASWTIVIFFAFFPGISTAAEEADADLGAVRDLIERTRADVRSTQKKLTTEERSLARIETETQNSLTVLEQQTEAMQSKTAKMRALLASRTVIHVALQSSRSSLAGQVSAAYLLSRHDRLQLLLNQQDPLKMDRTLLYYRYHQRVILKRIAKLTRQLDHLEQVEGEITHYEKELAELRGVHAKTLRLYQKQRQKRKEIIVVLKQRLSTQDRTLKDLNRQEEDLLAILHQNTLPNPASVTKFKRLSRLRGKLIWPLKGKHVISFGQKRSGGLRWKGVFIKASTGEAVRSVEQGRVIFSGWFSGLGHMMIIDHHHGYMTIYGHNSQLLKHVGEEVASEEIIARTGDSGGQLQSGLYFELRHQGEALDPSDWFH